MSHEKTLGQKRVGIDFNTLNDSKVDTIKAVYAGIIDTLQSERPLTEESEKQRLISQAQTAAEEACMWAVKAVTG